MKTFDQLFLSNGLCSSYWASLACMKLLELRSLISLFGSVGEFWSFLSGYICFTVVDIEGGNNSSSAPCTGGARVLKGCTLIGAQGVNGVGLIGFQVKMISQKFVIQQVKKGQNFHREEITFEPLPFVRSKRQPRYLHGENYSTGFSHSLVKYQKSHSFAAFTPSISDTSATRVKIPYTRAFHEVMWFSRYVIAAMLVDGNKRFLISSFCFSTSICTLQHCCLCP